jgi:predicted phage tail protein
MVRVWIDVLVRQRGCPRVTVGTWPFRYCRDRSRSAIWRPGTGVSRKFVYQQRHKARVALDDAFRSATPDDEGLFELVVTKVWLRQVIIALAQICRGSCRGVIEFVRDLLGVSMSVGTVHQVLQSAARKADIINQEQDLSAIRVGLHDELFQGAMPVLAGVDAQST